MIKNTLLALGCIVSLCINDSVVLAAESDAVSAFTTVHQVRGKAVKSAVDLSRFGQAVGDKRIVILDELTHGESNVFALKREIIEYLHQHKGFDVLLLESGIYDVSRIWNNDKAPLKAQAPGNVFYMYANNPAVHKLFDYIDDKRNTKRPLYLAGFDGRLSGELSQNEVIDKLQAFVTKHYPNVAKQFDWPFFNIQTEYILKRHSEHLNQLDESERFAYLTMANQLTDLLGKQQVMGRGYDGSRFWAQIIKGNAMVGQQLWQMRRFDENDLVMAENVDWLMNEVFPGKKVIVWGHFVHVNRQGMGPNRYANLGSKLVELYPGQVYMAHFAGAKGEFTNFITGKVDQVPSVNAATNVATFETSVLNPTTSIGFIDKQDINFNHPKVHSHTLWGIDYGYTMPLSHFPKIMDGMFVLDKVTTSK